MNQMGVSSGSYVFTRINRIGSIMELKFYIRVQEEDIRVQEEFVLILSVSRRARPIRKVALWITRPSQTIEVHYKFEKGDRVISQKI